MPESIHHTDDADTAPVDPQAASFNSDALLVNADVASVDTEGLLIGLLERYSPSGQEAEAVAYLVRFMRDLGFDAEIDGAGNAVGRLGSGDRTLLLLGHIDTVPGFIEPRREGAPRERGILYGRGAVDAKGPLAAFTVAAARAGPQEGLQIVVVGAVEEEAATSKGARYLLDRLTPDAVVIGEPSGWDAVTVGYKGRLLVDYTLDSPIGHTAGPDGTVCDAAFGFWAGVQAYATAFNAGRRRLFNRLSPSLRAMHAEDDGFSERATLTLGFRLPPDLDIDALQAELLGLAGEAHLTFRSHEPAYHAAKSTSLAHAFVRAIDAEGGRVQFKVKSGTSDMNVVGPVWQCPILAYGPGDSALDHTPHEHIDLQEYHRAIAVLTQVIRSV